MKLKIDSHQGLVITPAIFIIWKPFNFGIVWLFWAVYFE